MSSHCTHTRPRLHLQCDQRPGSRELSEVASASAITVNSVPLGRIEFQSSQHAYRSSDMHDCSFECQQDIPPAVQPGRAAVTPD